MPGQPETRRAGAALAHLRSTQRREREPQPAGPQPAASCTPSPSSAAGPPDGRFPAAAAARPLMGAPGCALQSQFPPARGEDGNTAAPTRSRNVRGRILRGLLGLPSAPAPHGHPRLLRQVLTAASCPEPWGPPARPSARLRSPRPRTSRGPPARHPGPGSGPEDPCTWQACPSGRGAGPSDATLLHVVTPTRVPSFPGGGQLQRPGPQARGTPAGARGLGPTPGLRGRAPRPPAGPAPGEAASASSAPWGCHCRPRLLPPDFTPPKDSPWGGRRGAPSVGGHRP